MNIEGKVILVSGAGSGLGAAVARMVVENGGNVVLFDKNKLACEELIEELGINSVYYEMDVTSAIDGKNSINFVFEKFDRIDALVNCAGIAIAEKIISDGQPHDLDKFKDVISVNLVGTFNLIRLVSNVMASNQANSDDERGVIIITSSIAAFDGQIGQAAYAASKAGLVGMTLPAARELAKYGIRVVTISPGIFETPMLAGLPEDKKNSLCSQIPFPKRLGFPSEFAALVKHIIENSMINGEVIRLDGSLRMGYK